jgi:hypothetical protein
MDVLSPLPLTRAAPCEAGLIQKLLEATAEIAPIPKRGLNAETGYAFAAAEDILAAVRGPLARHGLVVVCTLKDRVSQALPGRGWREQVLLTVTLNDGTSALSIDAPGEGQDSGDKAVYKAWTGAFKYALRSLLQLPFGEDPETSPCPGPSPVASPVASLAASPEAHLAASPPTSGAEPSPPPAPVPLKASAHGTERQVKAVRARARSLRMGEESLADLLGRRFGVRSPADLSRAQASALLDSLFSADA